MNGLVMLLCALQLTSLSLNWMVLLMIAVGISAGVDFLHQQHVIHRAVMSSNVLVAENYTAKLGHFREAMRSDCHESFPFNGKKTYHLPPEAACGVFSSKTDTYGLGLVSLVFHGSCMLLTCSLTTFGRYCLKWWLDCHLFITRDNRIW